MTATSLPECTCRTSATCPSHLEDFDLTLTHVPMGTQPMMEEPDAEEG